MAVFGRSDINRKFFPIALALISNEEAITYMAFFNALIQVCRDFRINFVVQYIMMDAANEEANAASACFPNVIILMCWFHLVKNIREPKHGGSKLFKDNGIYDMIMRDINEMHYCTSAEMFVVLRDQICQHWCSCPYNPKIRKELIKFTDYFIKQWLQPPFCNWQLFNTPPGFATTIIQSF